MRNKFRVVLCILGLLTPPSAYAADYPKPPNGAEGILQVLDFANWVNNASGRELDIVNTSATVDTITYKNPDGSTAFVIQVTYSDSSHSAVTQVKRTS